MNVSWDKWQQCPEFFNYSSPQRKTRRKWTQLSERTKTDQNEAEHNFALRNLKDKTGKELSRRTDRDGLTNVTIEQNQEVWQRNLLEELIAEDWQTWPKDGLECSCFEKFETKLAKSFEGGLTKTNWLANVTRPKRIDKNAIEQNFGLKNLRPNWQGTF